MTYRAPLADIKRALITSGGLTDMIGSGAVDNLDEDLADAILDEAGKFASEQLDPLNWVGDQQGATLSDGGVVTMPDGFKEAYAAWAEGGWAALSGEEQYGGQELPTIISMAACEIWNSANMGFSLGPILSTGAIDALKLHASPELQRTYLPKMTSGEWTGTMNLTESQAGSDLSTMRTKAVPQDDGSYRISGTKIYISYGEHDLTENIIHLVLARLPDAPEGTRGISLFLVPKFLVNEDGSLGARNDVFCTGVEEKLGIHSSPTCVMSFGDKEGAVGYLVGEENRGLNAMFTMMNAARLAVGIQGVAVAERATQKAEAYAQERRQGRTSDTPDGESAAIIEHPDVRRNLLTMRSMTQAARLICYATARELDLAELAPKGQDRARAAMRAALLTPVAKAFSTDAGVAVSSIGIQVHGGMGYVEETGAAQYFRDARILPIYEGTNGIQAIDLLTRKLPLENGETVQALIADLKEQVDTVRASNTPDFGNTAAELDQAIAALEEATAWLTKTMDTDVNACLAGATPYLKLFALATGGTFLASAAVHALRSEAGDKDNAVRSARFFAENLAPEAPALTRSIIGGAQSILDFEPALTA